MLDPLRHPLRTPRGLVHVYGAATREGDAGGVLLDSDGVTVLAAALDVTRSPARVSTHPGTTGVVVHPGPGVPPVVVSPETVRGLTVWDFGATGLPWGEGPPDEADGTGDRRRRGSSRPAPPTRPAPSDIQYFTY